MFLMYLMVTWEAKNRKLLRLYELVDVHLGQKPSKLKLLEAQTIVHMNSGLTSTIITY